MKDKNIGVKADRDSDSGTADKLQISFTKEHMTLLLVVYDGVLQIRENLLGITGELDDSNPETSLGKLVMIDTLMSQLSPLYSSTAQSGKKMCDLEWEDPDNLYTCILDNIGANMINAHWNSCAHHPCN